MRSIPRSTASSSETSMRLIELAGTDLSRGSIIIWQIGNDVNWRRMGGEGSEIKGTDKGRRAKRNATRNRGMRIVHSLYF